MTAQQLQALRSLSDLAEGMMLEDFGKCFVVGTSQLLDALAVNGYATISDGRLRITDKGIERAQVRAA